MSRFKGLWNQFLVSFKDFNTPVMLVKSLKRRKKGFVSYTKECKQSSSVKEVDSSNETINVPLYH